MCFADGQVGEDPVVYFQRFDFGADLSDNTQTYITEVAQEGITGRFAAAVQAQLAVPAVGGVGRVGAEAAQLGAVFD